MSDKVKVSVIIPTYKDWYRLQLCLDALYKQTFPQRTFEVLVVNNDPTEDIPSTFKLYDNNIILSENKVGSYAARNRAISMAKGDILAFTDSDCIPHENWISNAISYFDRHADSKRIGGGIELFYQGTKLTTAELYESVYAFRQDIAAKKGVSVTANLFTYKRVFDIVGVFNEELLSGGDNEWSVRAENAGIKISYVPNVLIYHPARHDVIDLVKKAKRISGDIGKNKIKAIVRFIKYIIPPIHSFWRSRKLGLIDSCRVFALKYRLNVIRAIESNKVAFGKSANRE